MFYLSITNIYKIQRFKKKLNKKILSKHYWQILLKYFKRIVTVSKYVNVVN